MFHLVRQNPQDEGLDLGDRFFPGSAIGQGTGNPGYLGQPSTVLFLFNFNSHDRDE